MSRPKPEPIPDEWRKGVIKILETGKFAREILLPRRTRMDWEAGTLGAFESELRYPLIETLSQAGVIGKLIPDQDEPGVTYAFFMFYKRRKFYAKICLYHDKVKIKILSAHQTKVTSYNSQIMKPEIHYVDDEVLIPNLDGDGIAERVPVQIPVTIDPNTGEEMLTEEAFEILETTKARYMGLMLPGEIRELRKRMNLSQKQIADLIESGEKSYTRWESGRARPSRLVNILLRLMDFGIVNVQHLHDVKQRLRQIRQSWSDIIKSGNFKAESQPTRFASPNVKTANKSNLACVSAEADLAIAA